MAAQGRAKRRPGSKAYKEDQALNGRHRERSIWTALNAAIIRLLYGLNAMSASVSPLQGAPLQGMSVSQGGASLAPG